MPANTLFTGEIECVAPVGAILGEGPLWDPRASRLLFVDIKGDKVFRFDPATRVLETFDGGGNISAIGLAGGGGYVCARRDGFAHLSFDGARLRIEPLGDPESALPDNRFNDGKVAPDGSFWAGTMDDTENQTAGQWWRLAADGKVVRIDDGFRVTNGPAFDPARRRVYVTDSARQVIYAANTDGAPYAEKRDFVRFGEGDGYPDGMDIDVEGCLWVAFWDGACIRRISPDAEILETIPLPVPRPTSVAIAGDRMFITSASVGLDDQKIKAAPLSGGLFEPKLKSAIGRPAFYWG